MTIRPRAAFVALLLLLAPQLASAQGWPSDMRRKLVDNCLQTCTGNTRFSSIQHAECPPYCECMIRDAQGTLTAEEYGTLIEAQATNKTGPLRERYEALSTSCGRKVFR
jgi:hypothetical protein